MKETFKWLHDNKESLIAQKKGSVKHGDGIPFDYVNDIELVEKDNDGTTITYKAEITEDENPNEAKVRAVINTTNIMDSHKDVHLPGLWTKSLKENRMIMHLQEHDMKFDKIIADKKDLKAYAETYTWKELGFDFEGETQALVFDSTIKRDRNSYMLDQYKQGHVNNHSVGMMYVKLELAINDKEYEDEYKVWKKHIDQIANKNLVEATGYFWAVLEAKVIEGSAVPLGSNFATPTLDIKAEPVQTTQENEPDTSTQDKLNKFFNNLNL